MCELARVLQLFAVEYKGGNVPIVRVDWMQVTSSKSSEYINQHIPVVTRPAPESTMTFDPEVVIPNAANATGSSEESIAKKKANLIFAMQV